MQLHSYGRSRLELLVEEYVESSKRNGQQPKEGLSGHMAACWNHRVTSKDVHSITGGGWALPARLAVCAWLCVYMAGCLRLQVLEGAVLLALLGQRHGASCAGPQHQAP
jgi:hypothetical protein